MLKSSKHRAQLQSQMNAESRANLDSSEEGELIEKNEIEGSPYWVIGNKEQGYYITFGKWRLSEAHKTAEEALEWLDNNIRMVLVQTMVVLLEIHEEEKFQKAIEKIATK